MSPQDPPPPGRQTMHVGPPGQPSASSPPPGPPPGPGPGAPPPAPGAPPSPRTPPSAAPTFVPGAAPAPTPGGQRTAAGDLTDHLLATSTWSDADVAGAGIPIIDVPLVSIGGGIGSFTLADILRQSGMPANQMRALGQADRPWDTYNYLASVSQIPEGERLRSDSGAAPDNIWGFPSLAVREAFGAKSVSEFIAPLFQVLVEPIFTDHYTPKAGQIYAGMQREADRIGWWDMVDKGLVRMTRKRVGGGYFTILTPPAGTTATKRVAYRSRYVHSAVGYPGLKFLPDLQKYRDTYQDFTRVVNAYEPHEHVYQELRRKPGTVIVRGSGIVGIRILQRLIDDRDKHGAQTTIIHLFRNYASGPQGDSIFFRRPGGNGFNYQAFNFPKAACGGQIKVKMEGMSGEERKALIPKMGGTNTPKRKYWEEQLARGRKEGFYRTHIGQVEEVYPSGDNASVVTRIRTKEGTLEVDANYIIDATGLEADIAEHRLLNDLLQHAGASRNAVGRLDVEPSFEVRGTRSGDGRLYASGSSTLGGYYACVDSFLGLQYAALQIADDLAGQKFVKKMGPARSVGQWWKWALNKKVAS